MTWLLLAVALTAPTTPEGACNDYEMTAMLSAPVAEGSKLKQELDRRSAIVLFEERAVQGGIKAAPPPSLARMLGVPLGLALAGLIVVLLAAGKKSRAMALGGALAILLGCGLALRASHQEQRKLARVNELRDCRFRLLDTRSTLEHGTYARCLNDVAEADEDLMAWLSRIKAGGAVTTAQIDKMRKEINHR